MDGLNEALAQLQGLGTVLALKAYRVPLDSAGVIPVLPCLDHEAMLHQHVQSHLAAYLQLDGSPDIHEVVIYPGARRLQVDTASTIGEFSDAGHAALLGLLRQRFPGYSIRVHGPSLWRGERRVAAACRGQVSLREVLLGEPDDRVKRQIDRLQMIGSLMEKESRVASWGVRTITAQLLAAVGALVYAGIGYVAPQLGEGLASDLRYTVVGSLGAVFLYYGMKAVQLTEMANRVWKRATEYSVILAERRRLRPSGAAPAAPPTPTR